MVFRGKAETLTNWNLETPSVRAAATALYTALRVSVGLKVCFILLPSASLICIVHSVYSFGGPTGFAGAAAAGAGALAACPSLSFLPYFAARSSLSCSNCLRSSSLCFLSASFSLRLSSAILAIFASSNFRASSTSILPPVRLAFSLSISSCASFLAFNSLAFFTTSSNLASTSALDNLGLPSSLVPVTVHGSSISASSIWAKIHSVAASAVLLPVDKRPFSALTRGKPMSISCFTSSSLTGNDCVTGAAGADPSVVVAPAAEVPSGVAVAGFAESVPVEANEAAIACFRISSSTSISSFTTGAGGGKGAAGLGAGELC
mmetsp:Transcript_18989/g.31126  ORF Transcript_18989/g.31126 Transcript_18989/m.31126 type:complete len:319 (+) Transcript_18989:899-1855(+)